MHAHRIRQTMTVHAYPSVLLEDHHAEECHTPEYHAIGNKNHYAQDSVVDVVSIIQQRAAPCYEPYAGILLRICNHKCFQSPLCVAQVCEEGVLLLGCY